MALSRHQEGALLMTRWFILIILMLGFEACAQISPDSLPAHQGIMQKTPDSLSAIPGIANQQQAQKIRIIKKEINFSTATKLAMGMMVFIAVLFFTTQSWNPGNQ
jgi:type VI protein secretion system component VasF